MKKTFIHCLVLVCVFWASFPEGAHGMESQLPEDPEVGGLLLRKHRTETAVMVDEPPVAANPLICPQPILRQYVVAPDKSSACPRTWCALWKNHPRVKRVLVCGAVVVGSCALLGCGGYWLISTLVGSAAVLTAGGAGENETAPFVNATIFASPEPSVTTPVTVSPPPSGNTTCPYGAGYFDIFHGNDKQWNEGCKPCPPSTTYVDQFHKANDPTHSPVECPRPGKTISHRDSNGTVVEVHRCGEDHVLYRCRLSSSASEGSPEAHTPPPPPQATPVPEPTPAPVCPEKTIEHPTNETCLYPSLTRNFGIGDFQKCGANKRWHTCETRCPSGRHKDGTFYYPRLYCLESLEKPHTSLLELGDSLRAEKPDGKVEVGVCGFDGHVYRCAEGNPSQPSGRGLPPIPEEGPDTGVWRRFDCPRETVLDEAQNFADPCPRDFIAGGTAFNRPTYRTLCVPNANGAATSLKCNELAVYNFQCPEGFVRGSISTDSADYCYGGEVNSSESKDGSYCVGRKRPSWMKKSDQVGTRIKCEEPHSEEASRSR